MSYFIRGIQFLQERGIESIKGVDLNPWYDIVRKLQTKEYSKEEVAQYYLKGFTSGELLEDNPHYNSRQALYAHLERLEPNNGYRDINKQNRECINNLVKYYKGYVYIELTGDLTYAEEVFNNNFSQMVNYYIDCGGTRDIWVEGSYTNTKYAPYFKYMDLGCTIEHKIEEIKERGPFNDEEEGLVNLTKNELNSMKAAYGRNKKQRVLELILLGYTEQEITDKYNMSSNQYKKHYKNVASEVNKCYNSLSNKENHIQKIKYLLRVVGDVEDTVNSILETT